MGFREKDHEKWSKTCQPCMLLLMAQQSTYTPEAFEKVLAGLIQGKSLRNVCSDEDMPKATTVLGWVQADKSLAEQYARAREQGADAMADDIIDIADAATGKEGAQIAKVRIDARIWHASKMRPKKYGDFRSQQIDLTSKNTNVNATLDSKALESLSDEQLARISEAVKLLAVTGADRSGDPSEETQPPSDDVPRLGSVSP